MLWTIPARADTGLVRQAIGAVAPHVSTGLGTVLASVDCFPQYWTQIPDGLTGAAADAYAKDPTHMHAIPCAHTTKVVAQVPSGVNLTDAGARFARAQAAYGAALTSGTDISTALANAQNAYDQPVTNAVASAAVRPLITCGSGTFTDQGTDTVLNDSLGAQDHIWWVLSYSDTNACVHNFKTTDYSFVDGNNIWWGWMDIFHNGGGSAGLKVGTDNNATPISTRQTFPNTNVTSSALNLVTKYCTKTDIANLCTSNGSLHTGDNVSH